METQLLRSMIDEVAASLAQAAESLAGTQPAMAYQLNTLAGTTRTLAEGVIAYHRDLFAAGRDPVYLAINLGRAIEGRPPMDFAAPFNLSLCRSEADHGTLLRLLAVLGKAPDAYCERSSMYFAAGGLARVEGSRLVVSGRYNIRAGYRASIELAADSAGSAALVLIDHAETLNRPREGNRPAPREWVMPAGTAGAVSMLIAGALALLGKEAWQ